MHLPVKISPCPISEAIFEVRYETSIPREAVFGLVYNAFKDDFPKMEKLPVLQIPQAVRAIDANLKYLPEYRLTNPPFLLLVGPQSFSMATVGDYVGWDAFSRQIFEAMERLRSMSVVAKVTRIGLRYINTFEFDILPKLSLKIMLGDGILESKSAELTTIIPAEMFNNTLRVFSNTSVTVNGRQFQGSVIDIDTNADINVEDFFSKIKQIVEKAHCQEKQLFFRLLLPEFLASLNPEYGGAP